MNGPPRPDDVCREARALIASRLGLDLPDSRQADLEPYSLAILLDRLLPARLAGLGPDDPGHRHQRGGSGEGAAGVLPGMVLPGDSPVGRDRHFHRRGEETFELDARIRRMVTFAPLNLAEAGYPSMVTNTSAMDLILCRNVLMYFTPEAQRETVVRLRRALTGRRLGGSPAEASAELF